MESAKTHLGTPELHKRHSVRIEGGRYPKSLVMDQFVFDRFLMEGLITLHQHKAAEFLLSLSAKGRMWATGVNLKSAGTGSGKRNNVPFSIMPIGNAMRKIKEEKGRQHHDITVAVIFKNKNISKSKRQMFLFSDAMEYVSYHIMTYLPQSE